MSKNINEERLKKFRDMGIPAPMSPVDPSMLKGPVRNLEFAAKLEAIKRGVVKEELSTFIEKETGNKGFIPIETPTKKKPQNQITETAEIKKPSVSGPSFDLYEKALYGESPSVSFDKNTNARTYSHNITPSADDTGTDFLANIKAQLAAKAMKANQSTPNNSKIIQENKTNIPAGHTLVNENDFKEAVTMIASDVCKVLIKKFMNEFLTSKPDLIKENEKVKKAEIIQENIIKMDGNYFKITPVTVKKK